MNSKLPQIWFYQYLNHVWGKGFTREVDMNEDECIRCGVQKYGPFSAYEAVSDFIANKSLSGTNKNPAREVRPVQA